MRKKAAIITLVASLLIINGVYIQPVYAANDRDLTEIQTERKELQKNLSSQERKLNGLLAEMEELDEEVTKLNQQLQDKQVELEEMTAEIDLTKEEIENLQKEIEVLEESIDERFEILKSRAASYQKTGGSINYLEVLFGSKSFGDFISRLTAVNKIVDSDAALMEQLDKDMKTVEEHQLSTMEKLDKLNEVRTEQEEILLVMKEEKAQLDGAKEDLANKQQEIVAYVEELQSEDANLQSLETKVKKEIELAEKKQQEAEERRVAAAKKAEKAEAKSEKKSDKTNESNLVHVSKVEEKRTPASPPKKAKQENTKPKQKQEQREASKKSFTVTSTAYTANCNGCSGVTSTGIDLKENPNAKVIAVDPSIIPIGSLVHVEGYGYAIAGDTGGAIRGKKIDVFFPSKKQANAWGVKTVKVTIQ